MGSFGIGFWEIFFILVIALLVFGPARLPEAARAIGKGLRWLRKASTDLTTEISKEINEIKDDIEDKGGGST